MVTAVIVALAFQYVPGAQAEIQFYRVGKRIGYNQIDNTQPTTPVGMDAGVDMFTSDPADFTSARVFSTSPTNPSPVSPFVLPQFFPGFWGSSQVYPSLAEMDTNIPPGDTFGFLIEGGTLGSQLALVEIPSTNLFASAVPYFTNNAFTNLNGMDPTDPYTFTWDGFTPAEGTNDSPIFFNIYRVSDGQSMAGTVVANNVTSFQIPANTLDLGVTYRASLDYSSRKNVVDAGFSTADSGATYDLVTELQFTTSSQPIDPAGDFNLDGIVDAADYVMWHKVDGSQEGYDAWTTHFASSGGGSSSPENTPEPGGTLMVLLVTVAVFWRYRQGSES